MNVNVVKLKAEDGIFLNGFLKYNEKPSNKVIVAIHGMAGNCFNKREKEVSEQAINNGIDSFCFNNRGSDIIKYLEKSRTKIVNNIIGGSACENFYDCYYDIKAAITYLIELGYEEIYLCGHSLGATKVLYAHQRFVEEKQEFLNKIKAVMLISLVDIKWLFRTCAGDRYEEYLSYALQKVENKQDLELMPREAFMYPLSSRSFLTYTLNSEKIDIVRYNQPDYKFPELNAIKCPLFMRWGDTNELIEQESKDLVELVKNKVNNKKLDIGYIEESDHFYRRKEVELANQIISFLNNV